MIKFEAPVLRVYFNRKEDAPKVWSLDCGPGTAEILVTEVIIAGECRTEFDGSKTPCGWLLFKNVEVQLTDKGTALVMEQGCL